MREGGCTCGAVRYQLRREPMFVHCCHCTKCQTESGTAFALNALIESDQVQTLEGSPDAVMTPTESGVGQQVWRCPECGSYLGREFGIAECPSCRAPLTNDMKLR